MLNSIKKTILSTLVRINFIPDLQCFIFYINSPYKSNSSAEVIFTSANSPMEI